MITVTGPDGAVHSFPDETSPDVIKGVMQQHYGAPKPPEADDTSVFKQGPTEQLRGPAQSYTAGIGNAMMFGYGPEIAGASEYTANLGAPGSYERGKLQYEEQQGLEQRSNPGLYAAGEGTGMVGIALAGGAGPLAVKGTGYGLRIAGAGTRAAAYPAAAAAGLKGAAVGGPWLGFPAAAATYRGVRGAGNKLSQLGRSLLKYMEKPAAAAGETAPGSGRLSAEMKAALKRGKFRHDYSTGEWRDFLAPGE